MIIIIIAFMAIITITTTTIIIMMMMIIIIIIIIIIAFMANIKIKSKSTNKQKTQFLVPSNKLQLIRILSRYWP